MTLDDLIDDIGVDAARFFMVQRTTTRRSISISPRARAERENPVYYVQYAHARIASILRKAGEEASREAAGADLPRARTAPSVGARSDQAAARVPGRVRERPSAARRTG